MELPLIYGVIRLKEGNSWDLATQSRHIIHSAACINTLWSLLAFRLHAHADPVVSVLPIDPLGMNVLRKPGDFQFDLCQVIEPSMRLSLRVPSKLADL